MMNRHFIFALCAVLGFSVSGVSMAQSTPADKEAAAKAAKAKKEFKQGMDGVAIGVKFEFGSSDFSKSKEAKTYRITGVPAMVVVDAEGKELGRTGYIPGQTPVQYVEFFKKYAPKTAEAK